MAIDTKGTRDSLFGGLKKAKEETPYIETDFAIADRAPLSNPITVKSNEKETDLTQVVPKWATLEKVNVLFAPDQKEGLDKIAKKLMKYRSGALKGNEDKERITANTLIRALVHNFLQNSDDFDLEVLRSEDDVCKWVRANFGKKTTC